LRLKVSPIIAPTEKPSRGQRSSLLPTPATKHNKGENKNRNTYASGFENNESLREKWLHIFTNGSQIEGYIKAAAGIYCELFSCYMPLGQYSTAFEEEIEAIRTALRLLNLHQNKFERAFILSDSKTAILFTGSTETVMSREARDCQVLIRQLKAKHKQIALQWIPGHCQITRNELLMHWPKTVTKLHTYILQKHLTTRLNNI
jgi:ribonuclease HI